MGAPQKSDGSFEERKYLTGRAATLRTALRCGTSMNLRLNSAYLVKGWLDSGGFSALYGASGDGKTFVALDVALHVAAQATWHGAKVRADGAVVYIAAEGGGGIDNRVLAWSEQHPDLWSAASANFHALPLAIDLFGSNDAEELVKATSHLRPALIVVDTLARAMGAGDENAAKDMSIVAMNVGQVIAETGAHVMFVHHSGKDVARGMRGSSSLRAAVDTEISVRRDDKIVTATTEKQRERSIGEKLAFRLQPVLLGTDEDGDNVTSCVVSPIGKEEAAASTRRAAEAKLSPQNQGALEALREAIRCYGRILPGSPSYPVRPIVPEQVWRDAFYQRYTGKPESGQRAFVRAQQALQNKALADTCDGYWWTVRGEAGHART